MYSMPNVKRESLREQNIVRSSAQNTQQKSTGESLRRHLAAVPGRESPVVESIPLVLPRKRTSNNRKVTHQVKVLLRNYRYPAETNCQSSLRKPTGAP